MPSFRIATYNIHKALGMDGRRQLDRIAAVLAEIAADVVALQEVVGPQGELLAEALGFHLAFAPARQHRGAAYGNATLSRWPFAQIRALDLTVAGREPRAVLRTDLERFGARLHIFNLHLGTSFGERRRQASLLVHDAVLRAPDCGGGARLVLGDCNEWTQGQVTHALRREFPAADLRRHLRLRSFPGLLPLLSLDHIYWDPSLTLQRARHHRSRLALVASDHLPLIADLALG